MLHVSCAYRQTLRSDAFKPKRFPAQNFMLDLSSALVLHGTGDGLKMFANVLFIY